MTHVEYAPRYDQFGRVYQGFFQQVNVNRDTYGENRGQFDYEFDVRGMLYFTLHIAKRGSPGHLDYQIHENFSDYGGTAGFPGFDPSTVPGSADWVDVADHQDVRLSADNQLSSVYTRNLTHGISFMRVRFRSLSTDIPQVAIYFQGSL